MYQSIPIPASDQDCSSNDRKKMCRAFFAREFGTKNFGFETDDPWLIVSSMWPKFPGWLYVVWRVLVAVYFLIWCVLSGNESHHHYDPPSSNRAKWFIYVGNWQYVVVTLALLVQAVVANVCHSRTSLLDAGRMTWYLRLSWFMDNFANDLILVIGSSYWAIRYKPGSVVNAEDIHTHGITILYLAINLCISGTPIRSYHFIYSVIFGVVYTIFTAVYYCVGGRDPFGKTSIYPRVLDWANPGTAAMYTCLLTFVATPVCHFILYGLYMLKMVIRHGGCTYILCGMGPSRNTGAKDTDGCDGCDSLEMRG